MKNMFIMILLALSMGSASAQLVPAENVKDAKAQVEQKCKEGCYVLSPAEVQLLEQNVNKIIQEAYQAGLKGWKNST